MVQIILNHIVSGTNFIVLCDSKMVFIVPSLPKGMKNCLIIILALMKWIYNLLFLGAWTSLLSHRNTILAPGSTRRLQQPDMFFHLAAKNQTLSYLSSTSQWHGGVFSQATCWHYRVSFWLVLHLWCFRYPRTDLTELPLVSEKIDAVQPVKYIYQRWS